MERDQDCLQHHVPFDGNANDMKGAYDGSLVISDSGFLEFAKSGIEGESSVIDFTTNYSDNME